jgi:hypothetical protein
MVLKSPATARRARPSTRTSQLASDPSTVVRANQETEAGLGGGRGLGVEAGKAGLNSWSRSRSLTPTHRRSQSNSPILTATQDISRTRSRNRPRRGTPSETSTVRRIRFVDENRSTRSSHSRNTAASNRPSAGSSQASNTSSAPESFLSWHFRGRARKLGRSSQLSHSMESITPSPYRGRSSEAPSTASCRAGYTLGGAWHRAQVHRRRGRIGGLDLRDFLR